ncbi:uncharacterized protein [Chelonus insularis]|uniref:uncharacterized protein isoform X2 n=1 Tax=Chelonus insularis TaxID=460826 RepID=UPI00158A9BAB|nr:uncharacterized protein LOC118066346 isoform X2 [Chelonus insularis]XP_034938212.1 uncharacterized protein LOC118066346 isoform X2 [Chelonus insularis]
MKQPLIIFFLILSHHYALGKRFNLTRLLKQQLGDQYHVASSHHQDYPAVANGFLYMPEINFNEDDIDDNILEIEEFKKQLNNKDHEFFERHYRNLKSEYQNLCEIKIRKVQLNDEEFEYQPPHYHEIYCKNYASDQVHNNLVRPNKQQCAHPGFHCVQRSKIIFMVRRRWTDECWEPFTKQIASGCDCMWPVSILGDISAHY